MRVRIAAVFPICAAILFTSILAIAGEMPTKFGSEQKFQIYLIKGFFYETLAKTPNLDPEDKSEVVLPKVAPWFIAPWFDYDYVSYEEVEPYLDELDKKKIPGVGLPFLPDVGSAALRKLAGMKHLRWLDLRGTGVGDEHMEQISAMTDLEGLYLSGDIIITDKSIPHLLKLKKLKHLGLVYSGITDAGVAQLAALTDLETLDINHGIYEGTFLEEFKALSKLRLLNISDTRSLKESNLNHLAGLKGLKELYLHNTPLTAASTPFLAALPQLERFAVDGIEDENMDYSFLEKMTKLQVLNLYGVKISDKELGHISRMKGLKELDIAGSRISSDGLSNLKDLKHLERLNLDDTAIGDDGFGKLAKLKELKNLGVSRTAIGDPSMKVISGFSKLEKLWMLECSSVSDEGFLLLKKLKKLAFVNIYGVGISQEAKDQVMYNEDRILEIIDY